MSYLFLYCFFMRCESVTMYLHQLKFITFMLCKPAHHAVNRLIWLLWTCFVGVCRTGSPHVVEVEHFSKDVEHLVPLARFMFSSSWFYDLAQAPSLATCQFFFFLFSKCFHQTTEHLPVDIFSEIKRYSSYFRVV